MKKMILLACIALAAILVSNACVSTPSKPQIIHAPENPPAGVTAINDNSVGNGPNQFDFGPSWTYAPGGGAKYQEDDHYSNAKGAFYVLRFTGTNVKVYGTKDGHHGDAIITVDDWQGVTATFKGLPRDFQVLIFDSGPLKKGDHILKVEVAGNGVVTADRVDVTK